MDENKPGLTIAPDEAEPTVSLTFRDSITGQNVLKIISTCPIDVRLRIEEDTTGKLLQKYLLHRVVNEFRLHLPDEDEKPE